MKKPRLCIVLDPSVLVGHHGVRRYLFALAAALRGTFDIEIYNIAIRLSSQEIGFTRLYYDRDYENNNGFGGCRRAGVNRRDILERLPDIVRDDHRPTSTGGLYSVYVGSEIPGACDIVLFGAPWFYSRAVSLPKARRTYVVAYDAIPGLTSMAFPGDKQLGVFAYDHVFAYREFVEKYDGILAISEDSVQQCRQVLMRPAPNIYAIPAFLPSGFDEVAHREPVEKIAKRVVLAAPFDPRKGMADIPELLNESGAESVAIFGGIRCPEVHLRKFFMDLAIEDVEWWSEVDFEKQVELYSSASALLFPSLREGLGLPVLEAYACGTAAFVSNIAPLNQLVLPQGVLPAAVDERAGMLKRGLDASESPDVYRAHARQTWGAERLIGFFNALP